MKKHVLYILSTILVLILIAIVWPYTPYSGRHQYAAAIGIEPDSIEKLSGYNEVVIDAYYFSKSDIDYLHRNNVLVYSYLNIGSIEESRPYYKNFLDINLGDYENWPSEKWIDVSNSKWQDYIINTHAKSLANKGVDGFFIDNADVYGNFKDEKIFNGVKSILEELKTTYKKPIIVNGGFNFFTESLSKKINILRLADAINTESVYTDINFENGTFIKRNAHDRNHAIDYLNTMKSAGLNIYIVEYSKDPLLNFIMFYRYKVSGYKLYISDNLELE